MMKLQSASTIIVKRTVLHEQKPSEKGYACFWHKKSRNSLPPVKVTDCFCYTKPRRFDKSILSDLQGKIKEVFMEKVNFDILDTLLCAGTGDSYMVLSQSYIRLPEADAVKERVAKAEEARDISALAHETIEASTAFERQGFINGFRVAMQLMTEVQMI